MSPESAGRLLVVGFSPAMARGLDAFRSPDSVIFLEEPSVARGRDAHAFLTAIASCSQLIEWEYQREDAADEFFLSDSFTSGPLRAGVSAVLPGVEYATAFAARLAERLGLPNAGLGAAQMMHDKARLRRVSAAAGVPNPISERVDGPEAVIAMLARVGGPVIVKPAGRQAAVGVSRVDSPAEAAEAYRFAVAGEEGVVAPERGIASEVLAEQYIAGEEFSVEMLVGKGKPLFSNVTAKDLFEGPRPIERGHVLPVDDRPELVEALTELTVRVLRAAAFDTGIVHCEWIVSPQGPYLVECAGRVPGDGITVLLELAWGDNLLARYVELLEGRLNSQTTRRLPERYAAVAFAACDPGTVRSISGLEQAGAVEGVVTAAALVAVGASVQGLRSSWDRVAMAIAVGATADQAKAKAAGALSMIAVEVEPPTDAGLVPADAPSSSAAGVFATAGTGSA
ncbi:MAG: ATP-grasp domain-containing protein [Jatrophihabitantaceae bacterium]